MPVVRCDLRYVTCELFERAGRRELPNKIVFPEPSKFSRTCSREHREYSSSMIQYKRTAYTFIPIVNVMTQ